MLIKKFEEMNYKVEDNKKNMDRNQILENYKSTFSKIASEGNNLIKTNSYNIIQFYGIIFCYLNYYDYNNFLIHFNNLCKENGEALYEILIIYYSHFFRPIKQNEDFFLHFLDYTISKKEFAVFENGLNFIIDMEIYISIIDKIKDKILNKYIKSDKKDFKSIEIKSNLILQKKEKSEEIKNIIAEIKSIIKFSEKNNILLVYFTSDFWINILKEYNGPNPKAIKNCYSLRETFIKYYELVDSLFKKSNKDNMKIKEDIKKYYDRDEFAFDLDKNIRNYFKKDKSLKNEEIVGFIQKYNPYYQEEKYTLKKDVDIFDYIKFDKINEQFIKSFKMLNFETIFKNKITSFLNKILSKINNIYIFSHIIDLIDIKKISDPDKIKQFISQLKDKFESIFIKEINEMSDQNELNQASKIIAKFVDFLYINEKKEEKCNFLKESIDKLNKNIKYLIYNELVRKFKDNDNNKSVDYEEMKEIIYKQFLSDLDNINSIIELIDNLENKDKINFLKELMKKCKFTKN